MHMLVQSLSVLVALALPVVRGANGATAGAVGCGGGTNGGGNGVLAAETESRLWQRRTKRAITCASFFSTSSEYS
jgi:hypothetical protein